MQVLASDVDLEPECHPDVYADTEVHHRYADVRHAFQALYTFFAPYV